MSLALAESRTPDLADARDLLRRVWGHAEFRGLQAGIIEDVLAGRDALAVLPTGGGKSVCYQLPAILRPEVAFSGEVQPDAAAIGDLHHRAHEACYIANSVRATVAVEPR